MYKAYVTNNIMLMKEGSISFNIFIKKYPAVFFPTKVNSGLSRLCVGPYSATWHSHLKYWPLNYCFFPDLLVTFSLCIISSESKATSMVWWENQLSSLRDRSLFTANSALLFDLHISLYFQSPQISLKYLWWYWYPCVLFGSLHLFILYVLYLFLYSPQEEKNISPFSSISSWKSKEIGKCSGF